MFRVSGNQISITAGDTALMAICPDETGYVPTANDRAIFTVRERPKRRALIEKTIAPEADGRFVVCFESEDTARLKPREYVWDVRLAIQATVNENGEVTDAEQVITPCPPGILFVMAAIGELTSSANGFEQPVSQTLRVRFEKLMQGPRGEPGRDGEKGEKGDPGRDGSPGATGATPRFTVTAVTGEAGTAASVTQSGTAENPMVEFTIPRGEKGEKGDPGSHEVVLYTAQTLSDAQKAQARENIGAADKETVNQLKSEKVAYSDALTLEEIEASTNLSNKVASAEAMQKMLNQSPWRVWRSTATHTGTELAITLKPLALDTGLIIVSFRQVSGNPGGVVLINTGWLPELIGYNFHNVNNYDAPTISRNEDNSIKILLSKDITSVSNAKFNVCMVYSDVYAGV